MGETIYGLDGIHSRLERIDNSLQELNTNIRTIAECLRVLSYPYLPMRENIDKLKEEKDKLEETCKEQRTKLMRKGYK